MPRLAALAVVASLAAAASAYAADRSQRPGGGAPVLFSADEVQYDDELGLVVAKGHVEISQKDQVLLADTVTYNQRSDTVTASGHVSLLQPTGDITFADFVELHDDMRDGFIKDVRMLLSDRSRLAGNTARRIDGTRTEIRRAVYSPCDLCRADPTRPPLWQIEAEDIIHDKEAQTVEYHDALMEIAGLPILYTPYFSHPDPSVKRASGFLPPKFGSTASIGAYFSLPYYWVISPDSDATIRPMFTSGGGTVLGGEYRQRFGDGKIVLDGSVALGSNSQTSFPGYPPTPPASGLRGHLFGTGEFDLTDNWRTGFSVQRASDQTYLLRYNFMGSTNFLTSRVYAENFGQQSYTDISAYSFQSMMPGIGDSIQPFALPIATYNWVSDPDSLGGRWEITDNFLNLLRVQGSDMRRISLGERWRLPFNGPIGDHFTFTASLRTDGYQSSGLFLSPTDTMGRTAVAGRAFPQVGLDWRYPWVRSSGGYSETIEPIAMVVAGPVGGNPATIPNEDSQGFEFDETSLFMLDRFPGYDLVDTGQRVDYGLRLGVDNQTGGSSHLLIGQSYRLQQQTPFPTGTGLNQQLSDVVGRLDVAPNSYLDFFYRFRLASDTLALRLQEAGVQTGPPSLRIGANYLQISSVPGLTNFSPTTPLTFTTLPFATSQPLTSFAAGRQVNLNINTQLTQYWSMMLTTTRDIGGGSTTINSGISLTYRDECLAFTGTVGQSGIQFGDVKPGITVLFSIVLKNIGQIGAQALSVGSGGL